MASFMDGFMKGYSFLEGIEDNRLKRERDDYTFNRIKTADVRADNVQLAEDLQSQIDLLYTDQSGNRLTDEQVANDPNKRGRIKDLMNTPAFKDIWMEGVPKGVTDIRVEELANNPDGTVTPVFSHIGKKGEVISSGPATIDRKGAKADPNGQSIIAKASITEGLNKLKSHIAKFSPTFAKSEVARRKTAGYKRDLGIVAAEAGRGQQVPSPQPSVPSTPSQVTPSVAPSGQVPSTPPPREPVAPTEPIQLDVDPTSITERAKAKEPVSIGGLARKAAEKLESVGAKAFERGIKNIVNTFEVAAKGEPGTGAKLALDTITGFPQGSGRKLVDNFSAIEKKIGVAKAQEMRSVILNSMKEKGVDEPALTRDLERLEVLSPKLVKDVTKVEKAAPKDTKQFNALLKKDQGLISGMKPGAKFSRQTGGPSKAYKDALIRLHMANPAAVSMEALERGLRTGRMSKRDIQVISNKSFVGTFDKETDEFKIHARFADPKAGADRAKLDRQSKADRFKSMERITDLVYPDKKKQGSQRRTFASRMAMSEQTLGFDVTDPTSFSMIEKAEGMTRGQTSGWFADEPSDYPSHTPGIIAQGLGFKDLDEAKTVFIRPLQESKFYGNKPVPEKDLRDISMYVAAMTLKGMDTTQAIGKIRGLLDSKDPQWFRSQKPASLADMMIQLERGQSGLQ